MDGRGVLRADMGRTKVRSFQVLLMVAHTMFQEPPPVQGCASYVYIYMCIRTDRYMCVYIYVYHICMQKRDTYEHVFTYRINTYKFITIHIYTQLYVVS